MQRKIFLQEQLISLFGSEKDRVISACNDIARYGATLYLVGGAVRDLVRGGIPHDVDLEVHGISLDDLSSILKQYGVVNYVGKSFGVLKWEHSAIEWVLPRQDLSGRKPIVEINPDMGIEAALLRRDLTINAMAINIMTGELIDPFDGIKDLTLQRARVVDKKLFVEDPLRFFRVMHFIGRFNLIPDDELNQLCKTMNIADVSLERIAGEFDKLFLYSSAPSRGIRWLAHIGRLKDILPEVFATMKVPQEPQWHPEGFVFEHLMQAMDAAAQESYLSNEDKIMMVSAALCHDLGKASTTFDHNGRLRSIGHEIAGVEKARLLMNRISITKYRIKKIEKLIRYHMCPLLFINNNAHDAAYKRLAVKLSPDVTIEELVKLARCDARGRNAKSHEPLQQVGEIVEKFYEKALHLGVLHTPEAPLLQGKDFLDTLEKGPQLGAAVKRAYELQINENMRDKEKIKQRVIREFSKKREKK